MDAAPLPAWLTQPLVAVVAVPLLVTMVAAMGLRYAGWLWAGIAVWLGFYAGALIIAGWDVFPLTSTRKLLLLGLCAFPWAWLLDFTAPPRSKLWVGLAVFITVAVVWVLWPVLQRQEVIYTALGYGGAALLYGIALTLALERLRARPLRAAAALWVLALGTGGAALMGSSALLAQLGFVLTAALGGWMLVNTYGKVLPLGNIALLPLALLVVVLGVNSVAYATVEWVSLAVLLLVPLLVELPLPGQHPSWRQMLFFVLYGAPAAAMAIFLTWRVAGAPSL